MVIYFIEVGENDNNDAVKIVGTSSVGYQQI